MRKKIVAGNWKMNNDLPGTESFLKRLKEQVFPENVEVMIAPPYTNLLHAFQSVREHPVTVVAQNMHQAASGAYTGAVSAAMLKSVGVQTVILGHSERRTLFGETDVQISEKVGTAIKNGMRVIFCFGEQLKERKNNQHFDIVSEQLKKGLFHIAATAWPNVILAYEPVWAIGTGETATPEQAQQMHAHVRKVTAAAYSAAIASAVPILYGGSVKPGNAGEIFSKKDVDGGLVGGAALQVDSFMAIANSFQ
ncbi:MAG: triose-phosphate isomerase [Marinirhabdus sp.]